MDFIKLMYRDQRESGYREPQYHAKHDSSITGNYLIDRCIKYKIKRNDFKTVLVPQAKIELSIMPCLTASLMFSEVNPKMYVKTETYELETIRTNDGDEICFYYHEPENVLYLHKPQKYIAYVTIYEWDFSQSSTKLYKIIDESLDGFIRFLGVHFSTKTVITIITKDEIRHMWE